MLALSLVVLVASLGLTLLVALFYVLRVARRAPSDCSGATRILVLGNRLAAGDVPGPMFSRRLDRARASLGDPRAAIFILGGRTRAEAKKSEAEAGADYLIARGVAAARIHREDRSRHTLENLRFYRARFPAAPGEKCVLVTSRFHLARASMLARGLGIAHLRCAAEEERGLIPGGVSRVLFEALLIHWYVVGRTFSIWTGNARMIARIS